MSIWLLEISRVKNYSLSGKLFQCSVTHAVRMCFLMFRQYLPLQLCHCLLSWHMGTTENSSLFAPSLQVFIQSDEVSSGWAVPAFSAFSHRRDALVPLSFSRPFICPCLLYCAVQNLTQHSRNDPTGAEWSLLWALLLMRPRIPSAFAGSSSAWCPLSLFLPVCFLASQPPACPGAWAFSSLDAGLGTSPCWSAWASCQPSSSHSGSHWMAAQPSGVSASLPVTSHHQTCWGHALHHHPDN